MPYGLEGRRRSGVALAKDHTLSFLCGYGTLYLYLVISYYPFVHLSVCS